MMKQSGIAFDNERAMDKIDIEQERGITIMSKCTSIVVGPSKGYLCYYRSKRRMEKVLFEQRVMDRLETRF